MSGDRLKTRVWTVVLGLAASYWIAPVAPGVCAERAPSRHRVIRPVDGDRVSDLLAPGDVDSLVLGDWKLDEVGVGPGCAVTFRFVSESTDEEAAIRLFEDLGGPSGQYGYGAEVVRDGDPSPSESKLRLQLLERVGRNKAETFFAVECVLANAEQPAAAEGEPTPPPRLEESGVADVVRWLLLLGTLVALGAVMVRLFLAGRDGGTTGAEADAKPVPKQPAI